MKRLGPVFLAVAGISILVLVGFALDDFVGIPPRALTRTRIWGIKERVLQYAHSHNQLPHFLSELPPMGGAYDDSVVDEWGRPIAYTVSASGLVTLTSLGRDGKVGGSGKDADMIGTFASHDSQGRWSDELAEWSLTPH